MKQVLKKFFLKMVLLKMLIMDAPPSLSKYLLPSSCTILYSFWEVQNTDVLVLFMSRYNNQGLREWSISGIHSKPTNIVYALYRSIPPTIVATLLV